MKITKAKIKKLKPCRDGYKWFINHGSPDLLKTLLKVNKVNSGWATWLYTKLMTPKQCKQFAIYSAEKVLHIFEEKFPNDDRPRLAITAAKKVLKSNTQANRKAAYVAAHAARAAVKHAAGNAAGFAGAGADLAAIAADFAARTAGVDDAAARAAGYGATITGCAADSSCAAEGYAATGTLLGTVSNAAAYAAAYIVMREKLIRKAVKLLEKK